MPICWWFDIYRKVFNWVVEINNEKRIWDDRFGLNEIFLGHRSQTDDGIFICQKKYANDVLKRFKMLNWKSPSTPMATGLKLIKEDKGTEVDPSLFKRFVGNLMYLTTTRPDIMYAFSLISRFMETPKDSHWQTGKCF